MEFKMMFLFTAFEMLVIYGVAFLGLWKNGLKGVYSRRTRKEKFLTAGLVVLSVAVMLLFASRQEGHPEITGGFTAGIYEMLLWVFHQDIQVMTLTAYLIFSLPIMLLSAAIMENLGRKYNAINLPFFYYVVLFMLDIVLYHPIRTAAGDWLTVLLVVTFFYCLMETKESGFQKKRVLLLALQAAAIIAIAILDGSIAWRFVLTYVIFFLENVFAAFVINRAGVLRKTLWYLVTLLCFVGLFFLHFYTNI